MRSVRGRIDVALRLARRVQRRPVAVVVTVVVLLLAAAVPALGLRTTSSGTELLPAGNTQRVFFEDLARDYPAATSADVTVVGRTSLPARISPRPRAVSRIVSRSRTMRSSRQRPPSSAMPSCASASGRS